MALIGQQADLEWGKWRALIGQQLYQSEPSICPFKVLPTDQSEPPVCPSIGQPADQSEAFIPPAIGPPADQSEPFISRTIQIPLLTNHCPPFSAL